MLILTKSLEIKNLNDELSNDTNSLVGKNHRTGWLCVLENLALIDCEYVLIDYIDHFFDLNNISKLNSIANIPYWFGFWHIPNNIPDWLNVTNKPCDICSYPIFYQWLRYCKCIFVFSKYLKNTLENLLTGKLCPQIVVLNHPGRETSKFNFNNFNKRILQIGYWLRSTTLIFRLNTSWEKIWLYSDKNAFVYFKKELDILSKSDNENILNNTDKVLIQRVNNHQYDEYLSNSIILTYFFDSSINNILIEAIKNGTPIICNPIEPVIEVLGSDYPLFVSSIDDVDNLLEMIETEKICIKKSLIIY